MAGVADDIDEEDEEALLQRALAMSAAADNNQVTAGGPTPGAPVA